MILAPAASGGDRSCTMPPSAVKRANSWPPVWRE